MKKTVRIGHMRGGNLYCKIEIENGKLSISGVIGPRRNGNCSSCGQIDMGFAHRNPEQNDDRYSHPTQPSEIQFAPGWDAEKWFDFLDIWKRWHLNDMRPSCEHQRSGNWVQYVCPDCHKVWGSIDRFPICICPKCGSSDVKYTQLSSKKKLELIDFGWTTKFYNLRESAAKGELDSTQYEKFREISADVMVTTTAIARPKWKSPLVEKLLAEGWIEEKKREIKTAGWVTETEHPEGVLSRPCPVCGYKHGSNWLREELPKEVVEFLMALPDTDIQPAWV